MAKAPSRHAAAGKRWRYNRGDLLILLCGILAFLSLTFGAPLFQQPQLQTASAPPVSGVTVSPSAARVPIAVTGAAGSTMETPAPTEQAGQPASAAALPEAAEPVRIRYPSAGFDVPVHPLEPDGDARASQTIVPPETKDGYWLTPFGTPGSGSTNTTYVVGHSWDGAEAPFNHLSSAAAAGHRFEVDTASGTMTYQVDSVSTYLKASLKDSPIWDIVPNRLVLISCYTQDPWGKNVVVTASPVS